ncbi:extracellular solute-binding protein [Arthrobacter sp. zg-Y820]|uniref:sugar ABC transporter substrate-binding protein n=1 Tax=unclassified Arthrobacter TaxID=235627 RepID=UPI001E3EB523|nr:MULTISPECIES: extracellular solute-binding protein [unclassified Arthrobacter]MCC9197038.1 extracellular solute-binding protein [Arthrobacter sp. zg-Y820]MDK1279903.1 extracellular solute-binding protein [Arthrobacter sp. zg.Y820]MDK1361590.1 extracellular solute-binding protein [Arthrobacter sp. zg-Y1219]WIB09205.1 extracellular solute-binding protein [Arthrobacter sp. zg-Y820]
MRKHAAAGFALAVGATLLSGCSSSEGAPTLTWYINPDDGGQAELASRCSDASGGAYTIETSLLPNDAASQREQLARRLAAGDKTMDIMSLDPPNVPEYAEPGYLAPVPEDVVERTTQNVVEGALAGATWKDEIVAVPFWANTQILWYRKSVAAAAGLDMSQPVTWDQIMQAAQDQGKFLGVQGARAESMTVWVNALIESAGGQIVENPDAPADELQLGVDTDAGKAAAEIVSTIGKDGLGGPGLPTQTENTSMIQFQGDEGSFMVNYPFVWPATNAAVEAGTLPQSLIDDIGWALYPQVNAGEDTAPPLGGINLGVGSKSENPDLAYQAIECIVSPENQAYYFATNGNPPSNTEAYNDPEAVSTFPMAGTIRESLELSKPRPQTPYYNEISTGIQQTWTPPSDVDPDTTPATSQEFIVDVLRGEKLL